FIVGGRPGGGDSFVFNLTPEGEDVITHEVATALRLEALERSKSSVPVPVANANPPAASTNVTTSRASTGAAPSSAARPRPAAAQPLQRAPANSAKGTSLEIA